MDKPTKEGLGDVLSARKFVTHRLWLRYGVGGAIALSLLAICACSYSYVDSNNVRHVVGLVDMTIASGGANGVEPTATAVSVTSVGMHVYSGTARGGGVVLGYSKETLLVMPNNSCIDLQAATLCGAPNKYLASDDESGARQ